MRLLPCLVQPLLCRSVSLKGRVLRAAAIATWVSATTSTSVLAQAIPYTAQTDITSATPSTAADITGSPGTGSPGGTGNGGGYDCDGGTLGAACVGGLFSFGTYTPRVGGRG
jgi:hypothetical protein